jgi:hypothetical protein
VDGPTTRRAERGSSPNPHRDPTATTALATPRSAIKRFGRVGSPASATSRFRLRLRSTFPPWRALLAPCSSPIVRHSATNRAQTLRITAPLFLRSYGSRRSSCGPVQAVQAAT